MTPRLLPAVSMCVVAAACAHAPATLAPASSERITTVEGTAGRLRVSDGGTGEPAVVFLHGLGCDLECWRPQLDHLRAAGRRAVAYDQRGHGASERARDGVYTLEALAADVDAVARALGLRRFVLAGHSMSGGVLSIYAGAHPDTLAGLLYVDAVGDFRAFPREAIEKEFAGDAALDAAGLRAGFSAMIGPEARPATRERLLDAVARMDVPAFAALRRSMAELDARARRAPYEGPAAAIERDGAEGPERAFRASTVLGIPRTGIAHVSHWLMLDDAAATNQAIDAFLSSLPAP